MASTAAKYITLLSGGSYLSTILSTGPIALWPLSETSGTVAVDATGNGYTGTYSNVTLNAATFGDGTPAALWVPASESRVTTYSAGLAGAINVQEGTMAAWLRVRAASVWTDGVARWSYEIFIDPSNRIRINKDSAVNVLTFQHQGSGTVRLHQIGVLTTTAWVHAALTWSTSATAVNAYFNGVNVSGNLGAPGTVTGAINTASMCIGDFTTAAGNSWDGYIKYMGVWNRALTPAEVATLYVAGFAV